MVVSLGFGRAPAVVRQAVKRAFHVSSVPLGRLLATFDARIATDGVHLAASQALEDLHARWDCAQKVSSTGPLLVVANHPGAYDALVLLAAMGRADVAVITEDRRFLRALPTMSRHLLFGSHHAAGAASLRKALRHLSRGGALLHFGAGRIEPDPAFTQAHVPALLSWNDGAGALVRGAARAGGSVVTALVSGVHSPQAKHLLVNRLAEHFGVTTLALLLQVAVRRYHDVHARVLFSEPQLAARLVQAGSSDADIADLLRSQTAGLKP